VTNCEVTLGGEHCTSVIHSPFPRCLWHLVLGAFGTSPLNHLNWSIPIVPVLWNDHWLSAIMLPNFARWPNWGRRKLLWVYSTMPLTLWTGLLRAKIFLVDAGYAWTVWFRGIRFGTIIMGRGRLLSVDCRNPSIKLRWGHLAIFCQLCVLF